MPDHKPLSILDDRSRNFDLYQKLYIRALKLFEAKQIPIGNVLRVLNELVPKFAAKLPETDSVQGNRDQKLLLLIAAQEQLLRDNDHLQQELERSKQEYEDILIMLSHEFKNLLTSAQGYNSLLEKKLIAEQKNELLELQHSSDHVIKKSFQMIDSVLKMVQGEKNILKPDYRLIDIDKDIIIPLSLEIQGELERKNMSITKKNRASKTMLLADEQLIEIVMRNLIENACKYGDEGSRIEILVENETNRVSVSVKNLCSDLPENICDGIFEKFKTVKIGNIPTGTGIGLYNVKNLIQLHNGHISCISKAGKWIRFKFDLAFDPEEISK